MKGLCRWLYLQAAMTVIMSYENASLGNAMPITGKTMMALSRDYLHHHHHPHHWHHYAHKPRGSSHQRLRHQLGQRHAKQMEVEMLKRDLLSKLGFDDVPDVSKFNKSTSTSELRRKLKEYRMTLDDVRQTEFPSVIEPQEPEVPEVYHRVVDDGSRPAYLQQVNTTGGVHLYFPLSITQPDDPYKHIHVHSAKLRIHVLTSSPDAYHSANELAEEEPSVRVNVYQLMPHVISGRHLLLRRLLDSDVLPLSTSGWLTFDIRDAIDDWIDDPEANWGVQLVDEHGAEDVFRFSLAANQQTGFDPESDDTTADYSSSFPSPSSSDDSAGGDNESLLPHVILKTQEREIVPRARRSDEISQDCDEGQTKCCRVPVVIDFEEIGWDFILEPRSITVYYCHGGCPNGYLPAHNFVSVQKLLHRWKPKDIPAPTCAPDELEPSPLLLMYDNQGHLIQEQIDNFIVRTCKCR